jgi:alpha-L-fucosidase
MWCDIGRSSHADRLLSKWLNDAQEQKKQVTFNSRCGNTTTGKIRGDFKTPEYEPVNEFSAQHWEACRGLDPHSFGYNKLTPEDEYMTASAIVQTVVDITAKNGNLLLDIGPRADGTIPEIMATQLREAGKWFKAHGESIYNTKYWPKTQGNGDFRYAVTDDAFYIHSLTSPSGSLKIPDLIPYQDGDSVVVVGGEYDGTIVPAQLDSGGNLVLDVSEDIAAGDKFCWTFKIAY